VISLELNIKYSETAQKITLFGFYIASKLLFTTGINCGYKQKGIRGRIVSGLPSTCK